MTKLLVVSALQRSGTTALSHVLAAAPGVIRKGEIFHAARKRSDDPAFDRLHLNGAANFFTFKTRLLRMRSTLAYPSPQNQAYILDAYLDYLLEKNADWTLIDIKYNGWHHFEGVYAAPGDPPALIAMLLKRGAAIVHMTRKNQLARWLSDEVARTRGRYHFEQGETPPPTRITVNPGDAVAAIDSSVRQIGWFARWLDGFSPFLHLEYERAFAKARLNRSTAQDIERNFSISIPPDALRPPLERALSNPIAAVANWKSLSRAIQDTGHGWMARELESASKASKGRERC